MKPTDAQARQAFGDALHTLPVEGLEYLCQNVLVAALQALVVLYQRAPVRAERLAHQLLVELQGLVDPADRVH